MQGTGTNFYANGSRGQVRFLTSNWLVQTTKNTKCTKKHKAEGVHLSAFRVLVVNSKFSLAVDVCHAGGPKAGRATP